MKREKFVKTKAEGEGQCATKWEPARLGYKECNKHRCVIESNVGVLQCNRSLDIVLLIDGSGSLGKKGWEAEKKAATTFVDAFSGGGGQAQISLILYSGPRTWTGVRKCFAKNGDKVDVQKVCKIKTLTHLSSDMTKVKGLIKGMAWPQGSTLTSLALLRARAELSLGRKDAHSIVIAITDGRPLSIKKTREASRNVRQSARLMWVPVTEFAPLKDIKTWATRRWQENLISVKTFEDLEKKDVVTHLIANMCPKKDVRIVFGRTS